MQSLRLQREHMALLLGVLVAGLLLGAWNAGLFGMGRAAARTELHLSRYQAGGFQGPLAFLGGAPPLPPPPAASGAAASLDAGLVVGEPTLSTVAIDAILAEYGSPAQGQGAVFYQMGRKYGIDPAFALAFYVEESHCGTRGVARFTHGIGNIRWTPGFDNYEGYRSYPDYAAGIEDWFKLIRELYVDGWGLQTVGQIVPRYAPPGDNNDTAGYIATVQDLVAGWRERSGT
jgi:Mannosyl-glycoprotein endo-beta-N-acetylglucosaminidase